MFCMYAFDQKTPKDGFAELAREIIYLVGKLPLGLKVMGSHFRGLPKQEWSMEVERLRTNIDGEIESVLKFSYDALCDEDKDLFLHLACIFKSRYIERIEEYLEGSFKNVRQRLHVLAEKSLISIEYSYINMHNLLVKLGKEIVRKQSVREPGQRQFLVNNEDTCEVLTDYTAVTRSVVGIDYPYELDITENAFERMSNLQFLRVGSYSDHPNIISSSRPLHYISPKLRLLHWSHAPMTSLPFTINLEFLVELRMDHSKLEKLWDGIILLHNLKWMNLAFSRNLKELPNLSTATSLKDLDVRLCSSLVELPLSIGNATNLQNLYLSGCSSLVEIPFSIGNLHKLELLDLARCSKLNSLPININLESLDSLVLRDCWSLKCFPEISTNIRRLDLIGTSIKQVPLLIRSWSRLKDWRMPYCENLKEFPSIHNSITELYLTEIQEVGPWVRGCSSLRELVIKRMKNLVSLPQLPDSLRLLDAENCESLERLDCSFCHPYIHLNFVNCFKLNQEARDLIIQTSSTHRYAVLPGGEVPACFTYRASGSSVTVNLNKKALRTSTKFKACILFVFKGESETEDIDCGEINMSCSITSKQSALTAHRSYGRSIYPILTEHLYIFDFEAEELTSTELVFKFEHSYLSKNWEVQDWEIKECGIIHLSENRVDSDEEICERSSKRPRIL